MIAYVKSQIKRIRKEKGLSQKELGNHFTLDQSGFSKIENGKGKLDVDRLNEIATALGVDISEFFPKPKTANKFQDGQKNYGYASKVDIDELTFLIKQLKLEITALKNELAGMRKMVAKSKK